MCIRDSPRAADRDGGGDAGDVADAHRRGERGHQRRVGADAVSYTHLRAHETVLDLVCRLLLEKKKITGKPI